MAPRPMGLTKTPLQQTYVVVVDVDVGKDIPQDRPHSLVAGTEELLNAA